MVKRSAKIKDARGLNHRISLHQHERDSRRTISLYAGIASTRLTLNIYTNIYGQGCDALKMHTIDKSKPNLDLEHEIASILVNSN